MNSRKSQTFVGRPAEPGVYYILIMKKCKMLLVGWHGNGALGDDLLEGCVKRIFEDVATSLSIELSWISVPHEADYVLIGGGTLLGFDTMGIYDLIQEVGKPYSIFGTGFRREKRDIGSERRSRLAELLDRADHVYVRGFLSQQFCVHAGVSVPGVISDPAVWFKPFPITPEGEGRHIGVSLRNMGKGGGGEPQYVHNDRMIEIVEQCLNIQALLSPCTLHLFNLGENQYDSDSEALDRISEFWGNRGPVVSHGIEQGYQHAFSGIAAMDTIISQRLHPSIIGWISGIPHVSIDYQNCKTEDFCTTVGMTEFCLRTDEFTESSYASALNRLEADKMVISGQVLHSVAYWHGVQRDAVQKILRSALSEVS